MRITGAGTEMEGACSWWTTGTDFVVRESIEDLYGRESRFYCCICMACLIGWFVKGHGTRKSKDSTKITSPEHLYFVMRGRVAVWSPREM